MSHAFTNILIHAVFSTKDRRRIIREPMRQRLYEYMGGIARDEFGTALRVGGTEDHVHGLLVIKPTVKPCDAMMKWKSLSSGWVHKEFPDLGDFAWQAGYGAFSVSESQSDRVIEYINGQVDHHRRVSFQEEFIAFLERNGIEYDPRDVWD